MSKEIHERISDIWSAYEKGAQIVTKKDLGIKVPSEAHTRIKNYSGEVVLTIPEEDRVCTWEGKVIPDAKRGVVFVSYNTDCCTDRLKGLYNTKVEALLRNATYCMFCGKKVKWKD